MLQLSEQGAKSLGVSLPKLKSRLSRFGGVANGLGRECCGCYRFYRFSRAPALARLMGVCV
ncbi:hypothetical protein O9929_16735 [Vibrio lentus]|nr:hypothetical protein [Vibrio lentus]